MAAPAAQNAPTEPGVTALVPVPVPYRWKDVILGSVCTLLLLTIATALAVQFLRTRAVDLRAETAALGGSIETTLRNQGVSDRSIVVHPRQLRSEDGAHFYFTRVEVELPESINADGLENVIERSLWRDGIVIAGAENDSLQRILHLELGSLPIGELVVRGASNSPDPRPSAATPTADPPVENASAMYPDAQTPPPPQPNLLESREWSPPPAASPVPEVEQRISQLPARVAIIVDDGGYGGEHTEIILGLDPALTLAILPYTPQGTRLAERAAALGFEVMLHMPMENLSDTLRHEGQLDIDMPAARIENLTKVALAQVPFAVGVNNHMGSKYTANAAAMAPFLSTVKGAGLYFVDSGTTADSVAYRAAHELGIPSAARTLFLDNEDDQDAIRARVRELVALARQQGEAIGICHFRLNTAVVLKEMLPELAANGVELVPASELVR